MFKVSQNGQNRLDIEMSGKLNADEMKIALDELISKSKDIHNGKMLYEIIDFHLPSLSAIGIDFSRLPSCVPRLYAYPPPCQRRHWIDLKRPSWTRLFRLSYQQWVLPNT